MNTARIEPLSMLAAATTTQPGPIDILIPLGWLTLAAVAIIAVAFFIRKKLRNADNEPVNPIPFKMSDLRRLKAEGQMSDTEYERTKAALIAHSRAAMDRDDTERKIPGRRNGAAANQPPPTDENSDNQNNSLNGPE